MYNTHCKIHGLSMAICRKNFFVDAERAPHRSGQIFDQPSTSNKETPMTKKQTWQLKKNLETFSRFKLLEESRTLSTMLTMLS